MVDLHAFYYHKEPHGIHKWNGGEGSKLGTECKAIAKASRLDTASPLLQTMDLASNHARATRKTYVSQALSVAFF